MQQQEKPTITLNDKSYIIEDLSDKAQYFVKHISDLQEQIQEGRFKLDQTSIAEKGFIDLLTKEVEGEYEEFPEPEQE